MNSDTNTCIAELKQRIHELCLRKGWGIEGVQNPQHVAMAMTVEMSELLEHFQWLNPEDVDKLMKGGDPDRCAMIAEEFASKEQEIITALVTKVDPRYGSVIVELGGKREHTEAMLPAQEQIAGEVISEGDRIKVFVVEVKAAGKGPQIMLSRTHAGLVRKLFELEVPEIASGIVSITHIAREAGSRTKIAVASQNPDVDPIGACVGPKGGRVAAVVNELKGEKIDIIKYSEDPVQFVAEALSPSDVISVQMLEDNKSCIVVVPDNQLSLAIGKEGQNARLAAKLTGFKIDIKPESAAY